VSKLVTRQLTGVRCSSVKQAGCFYYEITSSVSRRQDEKIFTPIDDFLISLGEVSLKSVSIHSAPVPIF